MTSRRPAVAGQFYPGSARAIGEAIGQLVDEGQERERVLGVVAPHAGWTYSGRSAGILYSRVEIPDSVLVLCPNHRGVGADAAIMVEGAWELPTGAIELDAELGRRAMERAPLVVEDARAHANEHSLEVHLPLISHFAPDFKLTPISLGRLSYDECEQLGVALAGAIEDHGNDVLVVASSDMTHFESAESARKKDQLALDRVLALDPHGLHDTVRKNRISMCGVIPTTVMLCYARARGASTATLVDYRNSGDVTGDHSDVVAYAAMTVK